MPDEYISIEIDVEETSLQDDAITRLQDRWPTWEPNEADLEVVQIENIASMAAAVAETAASVPSTILQTLGQELYNVEPSQGAPAVGQLTITFIDGAGGYLVPAGSGFDVDGFGFETVDDILTIVGQEVIPNVLIQATEDGIEYNDLEGADVTPISALTTVLSAELQAPTSGGEDPDSDEEYMGRLLRELRLYSRSLVTLRDYELFAMAHDDIKRALALNNGPRAVAVFTLGPDGLPISAALKAALSAEYDAAREVNSAITIFDPAFGVINVAYSVVAYPGYSPIDLLARTDAKLMEELDPLNWGHPRFVGDIETELWVNDATVRRNKLIDALGDVEGVNYVYSLVLTGTNASGGAALTVSGRPQQDTLTKTATLTGGTYKLQLDGQKIASTLNFNATGTQVKTALESLPNVEPGDIAISGDTFPLTITHTGAYYGRVRTLLVTDATTLVGGTINVTTPQSAQAGSGDITLPLANNMVGLPRAGALAGQVIVPT